MEIFENVLLHVPELPTHGATDTLEGNSAVCAWRFKVKKVTG